MGVKLPKSEIHYLLGNKVRRFRLNKGLTQAQLGQLCQVSRKQINRIECGLSLPRAKLMFKLEEELATYLRIDESTISKAKERIEGRVYEPDDDPEVLAIKETIDSDIPNSSREVLVEQLELTIALNRARWEEISSQE